MKWKNFLLAVLLAIGLPYLLGRILEQQTPKTVIQTQPATQIRQSVPSVQMVALLTEEEVRTLPLDTYVTGVLLGEMPADFHVEALKAQAIAIRTYTLKSQKHDQADACTDSTCCQAYCDEDAYLAAGHSMEELEKIRQAVTATENQVLLYDGCLIDATYFSCSGGRTEDAVAVWGADIPYLRSVESPGEEKATHYVDSVQLSSDEFSELLGVRPSGAPGTWFGEVSYTQGGGVDTIQIGGISYTGTQLRQLLGLRSTAFSVAAVANSITITTRGFGHRVGMSQYGADAMARDGADYQSILAHYYPGTVIDKASNL